MWEAVPLLYWRVKHNGKWTYVRAKIVDGRALPPEVDESEK